ncbi:MAG: ATP-dependent Clp protease ATP-binding subunit [bacterium]
MNDSGVDLTEQARLGRLDPVIGRDREIERLIWILMRRAKNNPVLIGEAGVGKTAIVEGLAQRIINRTAPPALLCRRLISLDLGLLVAGTKYRGQFEERFKALMGEVGKSDDIILFIDEIHSIVGTGSSEGSLDAAALFKPPLARGDMQCIGATTIDEYRKYIEKDRALERRFQTILVNEPTEEDTLEILKGLRERYESHHQVIITEGAIKSAVFLSSRYLNSRFLPDKAIDIIDEACSAVRGSSQKVTGKTVERVISSCTGIPVWRMEEDEREKLQGMESFLSRRIFGQKAAVKSLSQTIRRSRLGLSRPGRPVGSFMFLGPSGVGKTALAKALAEFLFGSDTFLLQLDMSEFSERFSASRLTGAPPGYVGYDEGGIFTERIRRRPYSVILFDEIDKADASLINLLLQVLEEGRLCDSAGRSIDFRHTVIIFTSNLFSRLSESKKHFRPEFMDRLDDIIVFEKLRASHLKKIIDKRVGEINQRLEEHGVEIVLSRPVKEWLINHPALTGVRPLYQAIQNRIETLIADKIVARKLPPGKVTLSLKGNKIIIDNPALPADFPLAEKEYALAG